VEIEGKQRKFTKDNMDLNVLQERVKALLLESRFCFLVLCKQLSARHSELQLQTPLLLCPTKGRGAQVKENQLKYSSEDTNSLHNFLVKAGEHESSRN